MTTPAAVLADSHSDTDTMRPLALLVAILLGLGAAADAALYPVSTAEKGVSPILIRGR